MLWNRAAVYLIISVGMLVALIFPACAPALAPVAAWEKMESGTQDYLLSAWGTSSLDVFAVGFNGAILHYDGKSWSRMESGTDVWLLGIWGSSPTNVLAAGQKGCLLRYDGKKWNPLDCGTSLDLWGAGIHRLMISMFHVRTGL